MNSTTEPHADRPVEPILSDADGYAPRRVRWPGLLAVAILVAAAIGGMVVSGHDDAKRSNGPPDRGAQAPAPQVDKSTKDQADDTRVAQPARPAKPTQQ